MFALEEGKWTDLVHACSSLPCFSEFRIQFVEDNEFPTIPEFLMLAGLTNLRTLHICSYRSSFTGIPVLVELLSSMSRLSSFFFYTSHDEGYEVVRETFPNIDLPTERKDLNTYAAM